MKCLIESSSCGAEQGLERHRQRLGWGACVCPVETAGAYGLWEAMKNWDLDSDYCPFKVSQPDSALSVRNFLSSSTTNSTLVKPKPLQHPNWFFCAELLRCDRFCGITALGNLLHAGAEGEPMSFLFFRTGFTALVTHLLPMTSLLR